MSVDAARTRLICSSSMDDPCGRRTLALGHLHLLPDELICSILELLDAKDLGTLSCVNSVLHIFCNEDPLWMKLYLRTYEGLVRYAGTWKHTVLCKTYNDHQVMHPFRNTKLHFDGFSSLFLYKRWYRCNANLMYFGVDNGVIDRQDNLHCKEFFSKYDGKKPVLLCGLVDTWPAMQKWNIDYFAKNYGKCIFKVGEEDDKKFLMSFEDYAFYMKHQHDENPLYIFYSKFGEANSSLIKDYEVPDFFKEDLFTYMDEPERPPYRWLVIGPSRSGASWHVDPALTSAWNTLITGRKRWGFYPPGHVPPSVTVHVDEEDGDMATDSPSSLQWWMDVYPTLRDDEKPLECIQNPGETIFVPSGWWHCVLNLDTSIAVTQNFVNSTNFEFVCIDLTPGYHHRGVARAGPLAIDMLVRTDSFLKSYTKRNSNKIAMKDSYKTDWNFTVEFLSSFIHHHSKAFCSESVENRYSKSQPLRKWLHRLWTMRSDLRQLIWKGACVAFDAQGWLEKIMSICETCSIPLPTEGEMLPVGHGSNPVFLVGRNAIKLYIDETGQDRAIDCLSSELQFYSKLDESKLPLKNVIPSLVASGIVYYEHGKHKAVSWDGKGEPEKPKNMKQWSLRKNGKIHGEKLHNLNQSSSEGNFHRARWNQAARCEYHSVDDVCENSLFYPYIVTHRCEGTAFSNLRKVMDEHCILDLSRFLGEQIHSLHCLPIPSVKLAVNQNNMKCKGDCSCNQQKIWTAKVSDEWSFFISMIRNQREDMSSRLEAWGTVPEYLITQVESYLPADPAVLVEWEICQPVWLHMDVNDENILILPSKTKVDVNCCHKNESVGEKIEKVEGCYLLDFGDVCIGDPLYEMVSIYLDVFQGNIKFMKQFLAGYKLPLTPKSNPLIIGQEKTSPTKPIQRLSYRAMCYSILHEENALGAIFNIWKELRTARSWKEIEERVWGFLEEHKNDMTFG